MSQVHNTGPNETGTRKYKSLHRMLDIDNPVVTNCLIDQQEVETVLLIHTNNEAYQILDKQHKVGWLHYCRICLCKNISSRI